MREKGKGWQVEADGSGLESWHAGRQAHRQASSGPGELEREREREMTVNTEPTRNNLESRPERKLPQIQQSGNEWVKSRGRYTVG